MSEPGGFTDDIGPTLGFLSVGLVQGTQEIMEQMAEEVLDYAQATAPWHDITGEARAGLSTEVYEEGGEIIMDLFHTVDYGEWLETIQSGRFAVIMPTLEAMAAEVFAAVGGIVTGEDVL